MIWLWQMELSYYQPRRSFGVISWRNPSSWSLEHIEILDLRCHSGNDLNSRGPCSNYTNSFIIDHQRGIPFGTVNSRTFEACLSFNQDHKLITKQWLFSLIKLSCNHLQTWAYWFCECLHRQIWQSWPWILFRSWCEPPISFPLLANHSWSPRVGTTCLDTNWSKQRTPPCRCESLFFGHILSSTYLMQVNHHNLQEISKATTLEHESFVVMKFWNEIVYGVMLGQIWTTKYEVHPTSF